MPEQILASPFAKKLPQSVGTISVRIDDENLASKYWHLQAHHCGVERIDDADKVRRLAIDIDTDPYWERDERTRTAYNITASTPLTILEVICVIQF